MKIIVSLLLLLCLNNLGAQKKVITVSKHAKADFTTIQDAFNAVPTNNTDTITIFVKAGTYYERLVLDSRKNFVKLVGEGASSTKITYNNHAGKKLPNGDTINTWSSATFFIYANDFVAQHISFENNAGFKEGQAVAVFAFGDRLKFEDCSFMGFQDVLFCSGNGARQYYNHCYIEGTTDFIFGPATAYFNACHIHSKKNSHVTAASTPREVPYGFVFNACTLTADTGINKVSLGRPWQTYASVTYLNCSMDAHIIAEGWNNWKNEANEKTVRYAEYNSTGKGFDAEKRVKWAKQLTVAEAQLFTPKNMFGNWKFD